MAVIAGYASACQGMGLCKPCSGLVLCRAVVHHEMRAPPDGGKHAALAAAQHFAFKSPNRQFPMSTPGNAQGLVNG